MIFCSVCFGDPASPLTQGYNYGIMSLLGIISIVLLCFAVLFINIYKRNRSSVC